MEKKKKKKYAPREASLGSLANVPSSPGILVTAQPASVARGNR
jgi:hypothetical protein